MIDAEEVKALCTPVVPDGSLKRPIALNLFCGGGGAGMGLFLAGFDVIDYDLQSIHLISDMSVRLEQTSFGHHLHVKVSVRLGAQSGGQ
jgi:hypothetical protein